MRTQGTATIAGAFVVFCLLTVGWIIIPEGSRSDRRSERILLAEGAETLTYGKGRAASVGKQKSAKVVSIERKTITCSDAESAHVAKWLEAHGCDDSKCPKDTWLDALKSLDPDPSDKLLINVGVNKGFNFVKWLSLWRPDLGICPKDWMTHEDCGACLDCEAECSLVAPKRKRLSGQKTKHPLVLVGVEPVAGTIDLIRKAAEAAGLYKDPMIKTHLVQAGCGEVRTKAYMPECNAGEEECELISFDDIETFPAEERRQMLLDDSLLDIYPVDDILLLPDIQAAIELRGPWRPIDILHIDTEGHDAAVLRGARRTLAEPGVRMLSFEYHEIGGWQRNTLHDSLEFLDALGYDCYFQGQGRLFRLTGCWHDMLEMYQWSNVVCTRRIDPYRDVLETFRVKAEDLKRGSAAITG